MSNFFLNIGFTTLSLFAFFANNSSSNIIQNTESTTLQNPPQYAGEQGQLRWFFWNHISGGHVYQLEEYLYFPEAPDGMQFLNQLQIPTNFNEYYGSWTRGYILAPETGTYTFNVTGNDRVNFYFSLTENTEDAQLLAFTTSATGTSEHDKYIEQTATIDLTAGSYYYFELRHKENTSGDHARVFWKTPSDNLEYKVIHGDFLYDYTNDNFCNPVGTPCDDSDPDTIEDTENGLCGCSGNPTRSNACIGDKGAVTVMYYDGVDGSALSTLDDFPIFPNNPTRIETLSYLSGPLAFGTDYGTLIKCYINPPETGDYIFNIIGDNQTRLKISSSDSDDPADLTEICYVPGSAQFGEHEKYEDQTSLPITLSKDNYYYLELTHKENGGNDHYKVYWKTPSQPDNWQFIHNANLFAYTCETACMPEGTECDDNDSSTTLDKMDANCNCVGTPCGTPDCTDTPYYVPYSICDATSKHSNNAVDSWLSCQAQPSPYSIRPNSHWILYDLHSPHQIFDTHIWNYNVQTETGKGFKHVTIDFSMDGSSWVQYYNSEWAQADGTVDYEGFEGPDFDGTPAQYILVTGLTNWNGDNCSGFSEMTLNAAPCPDANTPCDDGNPDTYDDKFDGDCICAGINDNPLAMDLLGLTAEWQNSNVLLEWQTENELPSSFYEVQRSLDAQNFEAIGLLASRGQGSKKTAYQLLDTEGAYLANELFYRLKLIEPTGKTQFSHTVSVRKAEGQYRLTFQNIQPNPFRESVDIQFSVPADQTTVQLMVFDGRGQLVKHLLKETVSKGQYQFRWDGKDESGTEVQSGVYYLQLTDGRQRVGRKVVKG